MRRSVAAWGVGHARVSERKRKRGEREMIVRMMENRRVDESEINTGKCAV